MSYKCADVSSKVYRKGDNVCTGFGECLPYNNDLMKNILFQKINKCKYKCKPVICSNYETCRNTFAKCDSVSYNSKLCINCYYYNRSIPCYYF